MNVLLIDSRVSGHETIIAAINPALAVGIVFDYFQDTFDTLKARIDTIHANSTGISFGLIQHNYQAPFFNMLAKTDLVPVAQVATRDPELKRWDQFRDFITWCKTEHSAAHFDMMACALYSNPDWKYIIDTLSTQTGFDFRASTDNTGSASLGGNWFLESHTGVNLKDVYFTEAIDEYNGVLYLVNIQKYTTKGMSSGAAISWGTDTSSVAEQITSGIVAVYSNYGAFAALSIAGSIVTWGGPNYGADTSSVAGSLTSDVVAVYYTGYAFAALKTDGSVVTWGNSISGGDSTSVSESLTSGVVSVYSNLTAFAALKSNGSVVTWGDSMVGGDSSLVSGSLSSGVVNIYSNDYAFAALKTDGSVITWGYPDVGGDSSSVASSLTSGVTAVYSSGYAFAALKTDGSVITWGNSDYENYGGDSSSVAASLTSGVVTIYSSGYAFAALKSNGSVVSWGSPTKGGDSSSVSESLTSDVITVYSSYNAFAALKNNGSVITWGNSDGGGISSSVAEGLTSDVVAIYSTYTAFAALKSNGSVITWGNFNGGDSTSVSEGLTAEVVAVYSSYTAFAALKKNGSIITWGASANGGDSSSVSESLTSGNIAVYSTDYAFTALKTTATTFDLSMSYYTNSDRYNILRKKENRRRVNLTTLNNNVFALSSAYDIKSFNPAVPLGNALGIIIPDYVSSTYSITSTATIPNTSGSFIFACDQCEPVTISGTTYTNYGSYVYKRETNNTYTKVTRKTINNRYYMLYGGDGILSSGIAFVEQNQITYWPSRATALVGNFSNAIGYNNNFTVGQYSSGSSSVTSWKIASNSTGPSSQTAVYANGDTLTDDGVGGYYFLYPVIPCFLEGSTILTLVDGVEQFVPIEKLRNGSMVKTYQHGYKAIVCIGHSIIENTVNSERSEHGLFKCCPTKYNELTYPLFLTGGHSILVDTLTIRQRDQIIKSLGRVFKTDDKYRLIACNDERSEPWGTCDKYTVWHFALENAEPSMNYGVYANGGLLVESCSIRFLKNKSNMTLV